jgi:hypothetical protein
VVVVVWVVGPGTTVCSEVVVVVVWGVELQPTMAPKAATPSQARIHFFMMTVV